MTEPASRRPPDEWQLEEVPCDYCGAWEADSLYRGCDRLHGLPGEFEVVVCRACGLARTNPRPTPESLAGAYPPDYGPHETRAQPPSPPRGALRWLLLNYRGYPLGERAPAVLRALAWPWAALRLRHRRLLSYVPWPGEGRLLDVGCGSGRYVGRMAAAGWHAEGIDTSEQAVAAGRQAGLDLHHGTLEAADLAEASFDVVTMWQALEHVPSPAATLAAAHRLLVPGGRLLVVCPRLDSLPARFFGRAWFGLELPRHLTHFSKGTLTRHLEAAGFEVERVHSWRRPGVVRRSFGFLAAERGGRLWRWLERSRLVSGTLSLLALALGRTGQMGAVATRRPRSSGTKPCS